jgi:hypothetical protein
LKRKEALVGYKTATLALALAFVTPPLVAQVDGVALESVEDSTADGSFGLGNQSHFVSALEFLPRVPSDSWNYRGDEYYQAVSTFSGSYRAPLSLPAGARITVITCYFYDNSPGAFGSVRLVKSTYNTSTDLPGEVIVGPAISSTNAGGYHRVFESFDETVVYRPSLFSRQFYGLVLGMHDSDEVRFRGCNVTWNRQVTPAPASATFTDVPVGHPYHRFVEALVDAGITGGCGGGLYCVNAPITRGEIAVFLAAALGLHFPN